MGGSTSNNDTSRLQFPMTTTCGNSIQDSQNLLELIRKKESERLKKSKIEKRRRGGKKGSKKGSMTACGVLTYTKDGRTINRK
jgi:hypothetical protein